MTEPVSERPPAKRWFWKICLILAVVAAILWFAVSLETGKKEPAGQPVARSTDWAPEPTGPVVPVTLPKTPMTNTPEKAP